MARCLYLEAEEGDISDVAVWLSEICFKSKLLLCETFWSVFDFTEFTMIVCGKNSSLQHQVLAFKFGVCLIEKLSATATCAAGIQVCLFSFSLHVS